MKIGRIARYLVLGIALVVYAGGCSTDVMNTFYRYHLIPDDYRFGDLYRLANLPQFKERPAICPPILPANTARKPIHLYIIGDSFTEPQRLSISDFPVQYYHRTKWYDDQVAQLDTTKTNILIIETVERHFREHFSESIDDLHVVADTNRANSAPMARVNWRDRIRKMEASFASRAVESRLETILFFTDWALWLKELKAWLTQRWFGRVDPKTSVSPDGKHLLYYLDTDTSLVNSSFTPLPDSALNRCIDTINVAADRYRKAGFDRVYLSVIPNKTSIYAANTGPKPYNHLIERVQQSPRLTIPTIDVYTPYKASRTPLYEVSDAHWNCDGRAIWLRQALSKLEK